MSIVFPNVLVGLSVLGETKNYLMMCHDSAKPTPSCLLDFGIDSCDNISANNFARTTEHVNVHGVCTQRIADWSGIIYYTPNKSAWFGISSNYKERLVVLETSPLQTPVRFHTYNFWTNAWLHHRLQLYNERKFASSTTTLRRTHAFSTYNFTTVSSEEAQRQNKTIAFRPQLNKARGLFRNT